VFVFLRARIKFRRPKLFILCSTHTTSTRISTSMPIQSSSRFGHERMRPLQSIFAHHLWCTRVMFRMVKNIETANQDDWIRASTSAQQRVSNVRVDHDHHVTPYECHDFRTRVCTRVRAAISPYVRKASRGSSRTRRSCPPIQSLLVGYRALTRPSTFRAHHCTEPFGSQGPWS
jgi:hypothetical protein